MAMHPWMFGLREYSRPTFWLSKKQKTHTIIRFDLYGIFGFVAGRGTNMATSLANDVITYSTKRGSPVYTRSLDTGGAFDVVPHAILF